MMSRFAPWFLLLTGLVFAGIGLMGLYDPTGTVAPMGLTLADLSSRSEMRAVYGGMNLVIGLYLIAAFRNSARQMTALTIAALIMGGLALGRLLSMAVEGVPSPLILGFLAVEVTGCVLALLLRRNAAAA
ncbi:MAG: DUF4345 domain-containing protein [Nevskiales bacterium]